MFVHVVNPMLSHNIQITGQMESVPEKIKPIKLEETEKLMDIQTVSTEFLTIKRQKVPGA